MGGSELVDGLAEFARDYAYDVQRPDEHRLSLYWPGFASLLVEQAESGALTVAVYVRSISNDWPGDRTDLNELFSIVVALNLQIDGLSVSQVLVGHPVLDLPGEVYASYLLPEQPYATGFPGTEAGVEKVRGLITTIAGALYISQLVLKACGWMDNPKGERPSRLRVPRGNASRLSAGGCGAAG